MSFTIVTDVFCDVCGNWINGAAGSKPERVKANDAARRAGWFVKRVLGSWRHLCRDCREDTTVNNKSDK